MSMTHEEYNRFVQKVQEEAHSWGMETRITMQGARAVFEVYFDGWHELARETPFIADRQCLIYDQAWAELQARAAASLASS